MEIDDVNTLLNESWLDYWDDDIKQLVLEAFLKRQLTGTSERFRVIVLQ